jgi:hypothetical protein
MQPTPLAASEIMAILKGGFVPITFPIYTAARLMGNTLGRSPSFTVLNAKPSRSQPQS